VRDNSKELGFEAIEGFQVFYVSPFYPKKRVGVQSKQSNKNYKSNPCQ